MGKIEKAVKAGERLGTLYALQELLAERLDNCDSNRDIAALSRQLMQVSEEINTIEKESETTITSLDAFRKKVKLAK